MATIALTQSGEKLAENGNADDIQGMMLAILYEEGPTDLEELADALKVPERKAHMVANSLIRQGKVQQVP